MTTNTYPPPVPPEVAAARLAMWEAIRATQRAGTALKCAEIERTQPERAALGRARAEVKRTHDAYDAALAKHCRTRQA